MLNRYRAIWQPLPSPGRSRSSRIVHRAAALQNGGDFRFSDGSAGIHVIGHQLVAGLQPFTGRAAFGRGHADRLGGCVVEIHVAYHGGQVERVVPQGADVTVVPGQLGQVILDMERIPPGCQIDLRAGRRLDTHIGELGGAGIGTHVEAKVRHGVDGDVLHLEIVDVRQGKQPAHIVRGTVNR